jgi:hypothetical protein
LAASDKIQLPARCPDFCVTGASDMAPLLVAGLNS